jgi:hypothetical protein
LDYLIDLAVAERLKSPEQKAREARELALDRAGMAEVDGVIMRKADAIAKVKEAKEARQAVDFSGLRPVEIPKDEDDDEYYARLESEFQDDMNVWDDD